MFPQNAITSFAGVPQDDLGPAAVKIFNQLTTNAAVFPALPVSLVIFGGQITAFTDLLGMNDYEGRAADIAAARKPLEVTLHDNGVYVNTVCKGDLVKLEQSGYPISKERTPVGDLPAPKAATVKTGPAPGTFVVNSEIVEHAKGYLFASTAVSNTEKDPNNWTIRWMPKHSGSFDGFVSGTQYKFAVCAVGTSQNIIWLSAVSPAFAQ